MNLVGASEGPHAETHPRQGLNQSHLIPTGESCRLREGVPGPVLTGFCPDPYTDVIGLTYNSGVTTLIWLWVRDAGRWLWQALRHRVCGYVGPAL
jgi:hypothetical protein